MRQPCKDCPFRSDAPHHGLSLATSRRILDDILGDTGFPCHKTVDYSEEGQWRLTEKTTHCVGAVIFTEHVRPGGFKGNLSFRSTALFSDELNDLDFQTPVFKTVEEFIGEEAIALAALKPQSRREYEFSTVYTEQKETEEQANRLVRWINEIIQDTSEMDDTEEDEDGMSKADLLDCATKFLSDLAELDEEAEQFIEMVYEIF